MSFIVGICTTSAICVVSMVTWYITHTIRMTEAGHLKTDSLADMVVINTGEYATSTERVYLEDRQAEQLCHSRRSDLSLVVYDGIPRIGSPELMAKFPHKQTVGCILDGVEKRIHVDLARQIHRCTLKEPGLEVDALPKNRFWLI